MTKENELDIILIHFFNVLFFKNWIMGKKQKSPLWSQLMKVTGMWPMPEAHLPRDPRHGDFEWKIPLDKKRIISEYNWGVYSLSTNWIITSPTWKILNPKFIKWVQRPYVSIRVKKKDDKGNPYIYIKAKSVGNLMEEYFWMYIHWYKEQRQAPKDYELKPKDWDYTNFRLDNLVYVKKCNYNYNILNELYSVLESKFPDDISWLIKYICDNLQLNRNSAIRKIEQFAKWRKCSAFENYQYFKELLWIDFSMDMYKVYKLLIETKWELKDIEIVNRIRPSISWENKNHYASKVSRVRSKLNRKKIFSAIEMIGIKPITWNTNQRIAEILKLPENTVTGLDSMLHID